MKNNQLTPEQIFNLTRSALTHLAMLALGLLTAVVMGVNGAGVLFLMVTTVTVLGVYILCVQSTKNDSEVTRKMANIGLFSVPVTLVCFGIYIFAESFAPICDTFGGIWILLGIFLFVVAVVVKIAEQPEKENQTRLLSTSPSSN